MTVKMANQYSKLGAVYDEVMAPVPYTEWVKYLRKIFKRYNYFPKSILDVACGTGTVSLLLDEKGYFVTGVDISGSMIAEAEKKSVRCNSLTQFICQNACDMSFNNEFDAAISLFDSFNYILSSSDVKRAFGAVYNAVKPGGYFIFDLNSEYALKENFFTQDNFWDVEATVKHDWVAKYDNKTRIATVDMVFYLPNGETFTETHKERAHRHVEIIEWLQNCGFEFIDAFDEYSFLPVGKLSERIFYIAKKPT